MTSFAAWKYLPSALTSAYTLELSASFKRVDTNGSVPSGISKIADNGVGFFSSMIAIVCVFGSLDSTETGTRAPFSAISGPVIWISLLSAEPLLKNSAEAFAPRPAYRPLTKFEARGLKLGHPVRDLIFLRS